MRHAPCHIELLTGDVAKAQQFYSRLLGWNLKELPLGPGQTYAMIVPGTGPHGGILQKTDQATPAGWAVYLNVTNLKRSVAKARKLGAKVLIAEQTVPGYGKFATIKDPTGALFHLWQKQ